MNPGSRLEDRFPGSPGTGVAGDAGRGPAAGVADRARVGAGYADAGRDVGRKLRPEREPVTRVLPAGRYRPADRLVGALCVAEAAAGMGPQDEPAEAGRPRGEVDPQDEAVEPLADGAERVVVEGVHPGGLEAVSGRPAVPALPDRGRALLDHVPP